MAATDREKEIELADQEFEQNAASLSIKTYHTRGTREVEARSLSARI
jgi:hypothetical protein